MTRLHAILGAAAIGLLSACAQTTPPPTPTTEPMRGAGLPVAPATPGGPVTPGIGTEPMRGGSLPTGLSTPAYGSGAAIGTEPMRGGSLPTGTDQRR